MEREESVKGKILFFSPCEGEPSYFTNSLIFMCDHGNEGAMGIIINRPLDLLLSEVLQTSGIKIGDIEIKDNLYIGGPVNPGSVFVLHSSEKEWGQTLKINKDIYLSTSEDILENIAIGQGPKHYQITLGYSGWSANQLEEELVENAWVIVPSNMDIIFDTEADKKIDAISKIMGFDIRMISPNYGNA